MSNDRIPNAPGIGGPPDSEVGWYDEPQAVSAGECEEQGCRNAALPRQAGCICHGACEICGDPTDVCGPIVVRSDGIARCVPCAVIGKACA